jgi:hypothetical protein
MTPRTILLTALVAVSALALPAAASAQGIPKPVKFRASLQAVQTTTYKIPYRKFDQDCFSRPWAQGDGSETVTMKGSGTMYLHRIGKFASFTYNSPNYGPTGSRGLQLATSVTRTKSYRSGVDPGPCGGGEPAKDWTFDCSPKRSTFNGLFSWEGRQLRLLTVRNERAPRVDYANCQLFTPEKVGEAKVTEIGQDAPVSDIANPEFGKQIVLARKSFRKVYSGNIITSTTVRWQLTLYRVK